MEGELVSPEQTQEGKNTCHPAAIRLQPLPTVSQEEAQDMKSTGFWPQIAEVHIKGMISVSPDYRIFPYSEKALNSFTWDIWLSLINNNLLMFRLPALFCKTSITPGSSPLPPPQSCSLPLFAMLPHGLSLKNFHRIKHNSQPLDCLYFLSQNHHGWKPLFEISLPRESSPLVAANENELPNQPPWLAKQTTSGLHQRYTEFLHTPWWADVGDPSFICSLTPQSGAKSAHPCRPQFLVHQMGKMGPDNF